MKRIILCAMCFALVSCKEIRSFAGHCDRVAFQYFSDTLFEKPKVVGLKEIHLSQDLFAEGWIKVSGKVLEKGEYGTYIVMGENEDRVIVATTDLTGEARTKLTVGSRISVLGSVEAGKRGMPFLRAQSLKIN